MRGSVSVDPRGCIFAALLLIFVPLRWLLAALLAALIHEIFHILAIYLCGNRVFGVRIGIGGTTLDTSLSGGVPEFLCAMAGPFGSLLLLFLCHCFPELALCAGAQGLFNLLPVYPLDGGRALRCILDWLFPRYADRIAWGVSFAVLLLLSIACLFLLLRLSLGYFPVFLVFALAIKAIPRKNSCKQRQIRVQ